MCLEEGAPLDLPLGERSLRPEPVSAALPGSEGAVVTFFLLHTLSSKWRPRGGLRRCSLEGGLSSRLSRLEAELRARWRSGSRSRLSHRLKGDAPLNLPSGDFSLRPEPVSAALPGSEGAVVTFFLLHTLSSKWRPRGGLRRCSLEGGLSPRLSRLGAGLRVRWRSGSRSRLSHRLKGGAPLDLPLGERSLRPEPVSAALPGSEGAVASSFMPHTSPSKWRPRGGLRRCSVEGPLSKWRLSRRKAGLRAWRRSRGGDWSQCPSRPRCRLSPRLEGGAPLDLPLGDLSRRFKPASVALSRSDGAVGSSFRLRTPPSRGVARCRGAGG
eukprot:jgi/Tetstr1/456745/TSEL_043442.t1